MKKQHTIALSATAILLAGCTVGQKVRHINAAPMPNGAIGYNIIGVTEIGEMEEAHADPYIQQGITAACSGDGEVLEKTIEPSKNGLGQDLLLWKIKVRCM